MFNEIPINNVFLINFKLSDPLWMQFVEQFSVVEYIWTTMLVYRPNQITLDETVLCEKVYGGLLPRVAGAIPGPACRRKNDSYFIGRKDSVRCYANAGACPQEAKGKMGDERN